MGIWLVTVEVGQMEFEIRPLLGMSPSLLIYLYDLPVSCGIVVDNGGIE